MNIQPIIKNIITNYMYELSKHDKISTVDIFSILKNVARISYNIGIIEKAMHEILRSKSPSNFNN